MDQWLLAVTSSSAVKGLAIDLEVASSGLVHCHFLLPLSFLPCVLHQVVLFCMVHRPSSTFGKILCKRMYMHIVCTVAVEHDTVWGGGGGMTTMPVRPIATDH